MPLILTTTPRTSWSPTVLFGHPLRHVGALLASSPVIFTIDTWRSHRLLGSRCGTSCGGARGLTPFSLDFTTLINALAMGYFNSFVGLLAHWIVSALLRP